MDTGSNLVTQLYGIARATKVVQKNTKILQLLELYKQARSCLRDQLRLDVQADPEALEWQEKRYKRLLEQINNF